MASGPSHPSDFAAITNDILDALATGGIDDFFVADYCAIAGVSRPTFYSRFGSVDGLLADLWAFAGPAWLRRLEGPNFNPESRDIGLALILAVAHRKSEVAEVVLPLVAAWWADATSRRSPESVAWLAANRLGVILSQNAVPPIVETLAVDGYIASVAEHEPLVDSSETTQLDLTCPTFDNQYLDAAFSVVGRVGYKNASLSRIARFALVTTGTLQPQFENAPNLLARVYSDAHAQIVDGNNSLWRSNGFSVETFGAYVKGGLAEPRQRWRRLRLETFIAARNQRTEITKMAAQSIGKMGESLDDTIRVAGISEELVTPVTYFFHTVGLGMTVLDNARIPVADLAHAEMTRLVVGQLLEGVTTQLASATVLGR